MSHLVDMLAYYIATVAKDKEISAFVQVLEWEFLFESIGRLL